MSNNFDKKVGNKKVRSGFNYFFMGLSSCFSKEYRRYIWLPVIVDLVIWIGLWFVGVHYFTSFMHKINSWLPSWLHWLDILFWVVYLAAFLVLGSYLFTLIANILLAPFLSVLAESVQNTYSGKRVDSVPWAKIPKVIVRSISREMRKIAYFVPWLIILGLLFLIPGINIIASVCWFLFGAWMQGIQYLDYCVDNNNKSFANLKRFMAANRWDSFSFGCAVMLILMIPVISILAAPAAVIGGTNLVLDLGLQED